MGKIEIGNINSTYSQVGSNNKMIISSRLNTYEDELLKLFNENCTTNEEKAELIHALKNIEEDGEDTSKSADRILKFIKSIGIDIAATGIVEILHDLIKQPH
jgi:hypothetical protein